MSMKHESPSLHQAVDPEEYLCQNCDKQFYLVATDKFVCPYCGASGLKYIVLLTELESNEDAYERS